MADVEDVERIAVGLGEAVHPYDDPLAGVDLLLQLICRVGDLALEPPVLDGRVDTFEDRAPTEVVEMSEHLLGPLLHLVGESLDEPRATQRVGHERNTRLVGDHLLRAQGDARRTLGRQREHLVHRVGVQALGTAEHSGQRLDGRPHDVDLGLLGGERDARGRRVEPALQRPGDDRAVAVPHPPGPDAAGGAVLGDLLEEVDVGVEEEGETRRELVDVETDVAHGLDVGEAVGEGESELLGRGRTRLADVVAGDGDRMPLRHLGRAEADHVGDDPHRRSGREDELLLRLVLLQDVVLDGAAEIASCGARLLGDGDVHRQQHGGGRVDRHRRGDRAEVDPREEVLHVGEGVDGDTAPPDLAERVRVVGVASHQRRQVERGRETVAADAQDLAKAGVGVVRGAEAREHAHRPELRAVHRGVRAPRVGVQAGEVAVVGPVDGLERHARHRLGRHIPRRRRLERCPPLVSRRPAHPSSIAGWSGSGMVRA